MQNVLNIVTDDSEAGGLEATLARMALAGVAPLTIEGRIVRFLVENGACRVKELMIASEASYRGFYLALERLKAKGFVEVTPHSCDKRVKVVSLI